MSAINKLVGTQVGRYAGPILVVGGAPGAPQELASLVERGFDLAACRIISANEHAIHLGLKPHFACVNDDVHHTLQVHQEPRMRELMPGTKLLSRHWWADYRSPQLMACNSGLKALLYAAILGANPIIVIGIQNYSDGLYFHPASGKKSNPNQARGPSHFSKQTTQVKKALGGVPVRTVSGPLTQVWPEWRPDEKFAPRELSELEIEAQADAKDGHYICTTVEGVAFEAALIPKGMAFAVTRGELLSWGHSDAVVEVSSGELKDVAAALTANREQRRAKQARQREMIAKLRNSRRGIRRTIYDADIVRVIDFADNGLSLEAISQRAGLPKDQVKFMVETMGVGPRAA
jgi:hypothetical protein